MKKANIFVFFFAILFPVIAFGALQATSEIISINQIKTTITGLEAGQSADVIVGVSLKDSKTDKVSLLSRVKVNENTSIITTSKNPISSSVFEAHTASRISTTATVQSNNLPVDQIKIIGVGQAANSITVKADFSNLKDYTVWKVGVGCDQEAEGYDSTNSPLDKGREFYFEKIDGQVYLYELTANGSRDRLRITTKQEDEDFFNNRVITIDFTKARPDAKYGCFVYAVKGETFGSTVSHSNRINFDTKALEAFIEDFCVIDQNTIDVLVSYYGYDLDNYSPIVYLKTKMNKAGSNWVTERKDILPSTPDTGERLKQRCAVKKNNQIRLRLQGLKPGVDYYVAPVSYIEGLSYSSIEWETFKINNGMVHVLANGKKGFLGTFYPRKTNTSAIVITTDKPTLINSGKSTFNKCAEYVTLKGTVTDKRGTKEGYTYWFKIVDGNNIYCTKSTPVKNGTTKLFLDISSCNPLYTVYACTKTGTPDISNPKRFRMFPNKKYTITAIAKDSNDIYLGNEKVFDWKLDAIIGILEVGYTDTVDKNGIKLTGKYPTNQSIFKGAFRIVEVDSKDREIGTPIITHPNASKIFGANSFYYDLYSGSFSALNESGEHAITATIKPNTKYKVNAIVYNLAGLLKSGSTFPITKALRYSINLHAQTTLFHQCNYACSAYQDNFCETGCGECSIAVAINYFYKVNSNVRERWDNIMGKAPDNPCIVTQFEVDYGALVGKTWYADAMELALNKIGLTYRLVYDDVNTLHAKYTSKGVPVILRCLPDSGLANKQHFIVMTGVSGSNITMRSSNSTHPSYTSKSNAQLCINTNKGNINGNAFVIAPPEFFAQNN